jgi:DNA-binding XRE family transcriptional regulator
MKANFQASYITTPGGEELAVLPRSALDALVEEAGHAKALAEHHAGRDPGLSAPEMRELLAAVSPLAFWRRKRGLSQADVAKAAGIAQNYVSDLETGKREGSATQWLKIARALGVSMEELIADSDAPTEGGAKKPGEVKLA